MINEFSQELVLFTNNQMKPTRPGLLTIIFLGTAFFLMAQDVTQVFKWKVSSKKVSATEYELEFSTTPEKSWQLYAPNQDLSGVPSSTLSLDSSIKHTSLFKDSGVTKVMSSGLFPIPVKLYEQATSWKINIIFSGPAPAHLQGELTYAYGKNLEFYQENYKFSVPLEGGVEASSRILIPTLDLEHPVSSCGDNIVSQGLWGIFLLGLGAGLLSLLFPCIFPLIPMTVSFFTKKSMTRKKGIINACWYGFSIFLIFILLSLPFHIFNIQPELLNNISTNVPLNLLFFVVFIVFALSFFGYFEIVLPGSLATRADSRSGIGDLLGIFFMALTLVIVSFSCTGPILGTLLVSAFSSQNGAWQLTSGMAGFGIGLGLPFVLFALFPHWLQSIPKSGGWMNELKVVFGFIELAMAIKFLSQADLVKQWGFLKREIFVGSWVLIGIAILLYLGGLIKVGHTSRPKFTGTRIFFIALFSLVTLYLLPGITNTKYARLSWVSGFPPPVCYSVYQHPVNCEAGVKPLINDYEQALQLARKKGLPLLIDFTGWACVNCRRMEENVWVDEEVRDLMNQHFVVVSLYVDEKRKLPVTQRSDYKTTNGIIKSIVTVGDKWATFQFENFHAVSQPQYAILSTDEIALTKTKSYTPHPREFADWLKCGMNSFELHRSGKNK